MTILLGIGYAYMEMQLPNVAKLRTVQLQVPMRILTADDKLIAEFGAKRRIPVDFAQIPKPLINAVLATEDARYYSHPGVDIIGMARAAKAVFVSGRKVQGASTITMQVARNFFLTRKKTYSRKIKEVLLALKIDKELSKDKVLELYLNKVFFGHRAYGVAAAAEVYYGKTLDQLTLPQMAMIAGLPQAPSRNNPLDNPTQALKRRNHVLSRMLEVGFINQATYQQAIQAPLTATFHERNIEVRAPYVAEMVRQALVSQYGKKAYDMGLQVYTTINSKLQNAANQSLDKGLIAYSERHGYYSTGVNFGQPTPHNLTRWQKQLQQLPNVASMYPAVVLSVADKSAQAFMEDGTTVTIPWSGLAWARPALKHGWVGNPPTSASKVLRVGQLIWLRKDKKQRWRLTEIPKVQGALIAVNPANGGIQALIGGFNFRLSNYNRATQAQRQPGSNFKPFIYSAAIAKGYTLASIINDAPVVMQDSGENQLWRPLNDTHKFYGPTRLRVGLAQSRNLVSIRLLQAIGVPYALQYVSRFGFDPNKLPHALSLALGSGAVTPLQIALGYTVFANGGYKVTPHFINKIIDGDDNTILYQAQPQQACADCITQGDSDAKTIPLNPAPRVIKAQNAYLMTQAMRGVITSGTGRAAQKLGREDLAGKTGTTNKQLDAWFSGFNSNLEATVWVGFDDASSVHEYGAQAALPIWINFMGDVLDGTPEATMPEPPGIVTVRIDPATGLLANPDQNNAIFEVFRQAHQPTDFAQSTVNNQSQSLQDLSTSNPTPAQAQPGDQAASGQQQSVDVNNDQGYNTTNHVEADQPLY